VIVNYWVSESVTLLSEWQFIKLSRSYGWVVGAD